MSSEDIIHISLSCLNLPRDLVEGVRVIVSALNEDDHNFVEIGQTETVSGHTSPRFERTIPIVARLDLEQRLRFTLYRTDAETHALLARRGEVELHLLTLLTQTGEVTFPVECSTGDGVASVGGHASVLPLIVASAASAPETRRATALQFVGEALTASDVGLQTAPYFIVELVSNVKEKMPILLYRSEVAHGCESPKWREFSLPTGFFPASSAEWTLQISCYNFNNNAEDFLLGRFHTTFYQLLNHKHGANKFMLRKAGKRRRESSMELIGIRSYDDPPSFIDSLKAGVQMHFTVAVDFTANNGGPNAVDSLHFVHPHHANAYMQVLGELAPAFVRFDKLGRLSMLGFGAKIPPKFELSQLFALNCDLNNPHVKGVREILHHYRNSAISLLPYAPTEYSAVIHHVIKLAKASMRASAGFYFTLVVLTNGAIRDIADTADTIVQASELPISIVFIAIGNATRPVGLNGNVDNLMKLLSPTLKSSKNMPLRRETTSLIVLNRQQAVGVPEPNAFFVQRIFGSLSRQFTLWALQNRSITHH